MHEWQRALRLIAPALFAVLLLASPHAQAHPHAWIDTSVDVKFNAAGEVEALGISWEFDEFYSAFAVEEFKKTAEGGYTAKDLASLAELNLTNLKEWHYFTDISQAGAKVAQGAPHDALMTYDPKSGRLKLRFTLPLASPVKATAQAPLSFSMYDPTYYISMEYVKEKPVTLEGKGQACKADIKMPKGETVWASLPESAFNGPDANQLGKKFAATTTLVCP